MARSINEIYNSMISEKQSFSELNSLQPSIDSDQTLLTNLTSSSKVAIWRLIFFVVAVGIYIHENLFDVYETEIENFAETLIPGTIQWYVEVVKDFQYGDLLIWDETTFKFEYASINEDNKIVVQSAAVESNDVLIIKAAKSDGSGGLEKLTTDEYNALNKYIDTIRFAGTKTELISDDPDDLKLTMKVYVDSTVIYVDETNPSDPLNGSLLSDSTTFPIEDAINAYISSLDFNGKLFASALTDSVQAVSSVSNVVINSLHAKYGALSYSDILAVDSQSYQSNAGYLQIDSSFQLADTITYLKS